MTREDCLSRFTHHWHNRRRVRDLNATECYKSVPLVQRNVSHACRLQVGQRLLTITRVQNLTQQGCTDSLSLVCWINSNQG